MAKIHLKGTVLPALLLAAAAFLLIAASAAAAAAGPPRHDNQHRTIAPHGWVTSVDYRPHARPHHARGPHVVVVPPRRRYKNVWVVRRHGHRYHGYGPYHSDARAFKWLAFTAITIAALDQLSESQQRAHEAAQVRATTAPVGEVIHWKDGSASGSVTATREGSSSAGRYCREFRQQVVIGGKTEEAYGTACLQPDGSWEVLP